MQLIKTLIFLVSIAFLQNCGTLKAGEMTTMTSVNYDKKTDTTVFLMMPQGNVNIKGNWQKAGYYSTGRQYFLVNQAGAALAIAKNLPNGYSFFAAGKTNYDLVYDFYKWEAEYWVQNGAKQEILKKDRDKCYIIWRVFNEKVNTFFVFGQRGAFLTNYSIASEKMETDEKVAFLEDLYLKN
jgi:hypothetical protein